MTRPEGTHEDLESAPDGGAPAPRRPRARGSLAFALWLIASMAAGLTGTSLVDYAMTSNELQSQLIDDLVATTTAQADMVQRSLPAGDAGAGFGEGTGSATQALDAIARMPYVKSVAVVDADGTALLSAGTEDALTGTPNRYLKARTSATTGNPSVQQIANLIVVTVPVRTESGGLALQVERSRVGVDNHVQELRRHTLPIFFLGLPLGIAVFYVTGGRQLANRHRQALQRSGRDSLTDLGNRRAFQEEMARAVPAAAQSGRALTLALIDVDYFKQINDGQGHRHGDEVLMDLGALLRSRRSGDQAFRIGGDEFAMLLEAGPADAHMIATELQRGLAARRPGVTLSIGLAAVDADVRDVTELVDRADSALYAAKRAGRNRATVYEHVLPGRDAALDARRAIERLIDERAVEMHFQPIWDLSSDRVFGYEALARPAPGSGFVFPAEAFEAAARCGLTRVLDEVCISRALERVGEMPAGSRLFLNLHPDTLVDPDFDPRLFAEVVAAAGLEVSRVTVEVTEQGKISSELLNQRLAELRSLDFRIALDDVGAGNAGIQVLRTVRVDYLKIDRSVVAEALASDAARAVLSALLAYAAEMDCYVIAEGIETNDMLGFVQALSLRAPKIQVGGVQGFHLGRPHGDFTVRQDGTEPGASVPPVVPAHWADAGT